MCGRYGRDLAWADLHQQLNAFVRTATPNLEPEMDIRPTSQQWVARPTEDGLELVKMRWWLIPFFHKGALKDWKPTTFNARVETVATAASFRGPFSRRRCLAPASCWYEWTGPKGSKERWTFTARDGGMLTFAGIWDKVTTTDVGEIESFSIVTQRAGAPLNTYHDRAPVVIWPDDRQRWLDPSQPCADLLGPESPDLFDVAPYVERPQA